jgi:hypothetical protein
MEERTQEVIEEMRKEAKQLRNDLASINIYTDKCDDRVAGILEYYARRLEGTD